MTRILVVSDIHANLAAFDAVLADAESRGGFDAAWVLGDTVGYGPQPNECLARQQGLGALAVAGNHELATLGRLSLDEFNPLAAAALAWTQSELSAESTEYLETLPLKTVAEDFTLVHGSPRSPEWEYLTDSLSVMENVRFLDTSWCANGHTHVPAMFFISETGGVSTMTGFGNGQSVEFGDRIMFVNPGSVGQPRDLDPRAAYALLDTTERHIEFRRVEYPVEETQSLMASAGLPPLLAQRLSAGR